MAGLLAAAAIGVQADAAPRRSKKKKKGGVIWPVPNPLLRTPGFAPSNNTRVISGVFGPRLKWGGARYDHHEGLDFFAQYDPKTYRNGAHPVLSVMDGVVTQVIAPSNPERTETGNKVVITHPVPWTKFGGKKDWGNVQTAYLHLSSINVQQGQPIKAGAEVGKAGATGYTSTVHLHFNCYRGRGINVNPARLFSPKTFKGAVAPLSKRTIEVEWLEFDRAAGTALARVYLAHNAYTLDGFVFTVGKNKSRAVSFEHVTATQRKQRDTGDKDLFPNLRLFPLRYNGGGAIDRVNARNVPRAWPLARYPVPSGKGVRLGYDVLATNVPKDAKVFKLTVFGVLGKKVTFKAPGFKNLK